MDRLDSWREGEREREREMGETLLTSFSTEGHHLSTLLSMDPSGAPPSPSPRDDAVFQRLHTILSRPPDINLPLSAERSPPPPAPAPAPALQMRGGASPHHQRHHIEDILDVTLGVHADALPVSVAHRNAAGHRKCTKRGDSVWGAWFFFNFYFKPALSENSKAKAAAASRDGSSAAGGVDKTDLRLDVFLVQHDMENMYMWVFKDRPENALGKMQLRSYMNGHSRPGEPQFPFSAERGFVRSHRMQRKQYRGLSNPQCVHGIEVVRSPNLAALSDIDRKKWVELTGRDVNFSIPPEASDFETWRNLQSTEFEIVKPFPASKGNSNSEQANKKLLNGSGLNLATQMPNHGNASDGMEMSSGSSKRKKDFFSNGVDEDGLILSNSSSDHSQETEMHHLEPQWMNEFSGVMRHTNGPVTAAKTIYEDEEGYLIVMSLPFVDLQRVKVSWKNTLTHGIVKVHGVSTARMQFVKRHKRTFKLTDPCPEHCPPGEFVREVPLPARIPEDATLEACCDETGTVLEILVPKHSIGPEEHEVPVCLRPHLGTNELLLS